MFFLQTQARNLHFILFVLTSVFFAYNGNCFLAFFYLAMQYFPRLGRFLALCGDLFSLQPLAKKIGYRFRYDRIPAAWIQSVVSLNMTRSWRRHGINAIGLNYWTIGVEKDGVSTRYLPDAKQYQSWLGAYLVRFLDDREFTLQDHFNLAVADQKNWLEDL